EHFVRIDAGAGDVFLFNPPDAGDVFAMLGVGDVAPAGELVALLTMFASALPIRLADDGAVAALGFANPSRCKNEVDGAQRILHAVGMMFDSARVKQKAG